MRTAMMSPDDVKRVVAEVLSEQKQIAAENMDAVVLKTIANLSGTG